MGDLERDSSRDRPVVGEQQELAAYRQFVASIAAEANGQVIMNRHHGHAAIIIAQIFAASQREVVFLTGNWDTKVYGLPEVISSATAFFQNEANTTVRVLHELPFAEGHPLIAALSPYAGSRFTTTLLPQSMQDHQFHFAVGDGKNLRFESIKRTMEAVVMFGSESNGKNLLAYFNALEARARAWNAEHSSL